MKKIILTTVGSLGDLHPFIAIALALKAAVQRLGPPPESAH
jgi:UDP:flavonoid glycosyltransferase YjiC (YdhE family)